MQCIHLYATNLLETTEREEKGKWHSVEVSFYSNLGVFSFSSWVLKTLHIIVVGCYRTPSATSDAFLSLKQLVEELNVKEVVLIGASKMNWLQQCLMSGIPNKHLKLPTVPPGYIWSPLKGHLVLTNTPYICLHISTVRCPKIPKTKPHTIIRRGVIKVWLG